MADWGPLVSMEHDDMAKLDAPMPYPMADKPDYPYGLRVCLCDEQLDKLSLDEEDDRAEVGDMIEMRVRARVTSVSRNESPDGVCRRVELQIEEVSTKES